MQPRNEAPKANKDLVLRERLAIERTVMANDRTFLSFLRTALYFFIAGLTINSLVEIRYGGWVEAVFWVLGFALLLTGMYRYAVQKKKIENSRKQVGGLVADVD